MTTLDVKNSFNSANLAVTQRALTRIGIPNYLRRIVADYFNGRFLEYESDDGTKSYKISAGVPQGSVLGPLLWNVMYDEVL